MKLLPLVLGIVLSILYCVTVGDALECFDCSYTNINGKEDGDKKCGEPFTYIEKTECYEGSIFCTKTIKRGENFFSVERGCNDECEECSAGREIGKDYEYATSSDCCTDALCNGASSVSHITKAFISISSLLLIAFIHY